MGGNDSWDDRRKAQEESYFDKQNRLALERLKARKETGQVRNSPVTGKPMEQITLLGVVADRCQESGGIWFDKGEFEQVVKQARSDDAAFRAALEKLA